MSIQTEAQIKNILPYDGTIFYYGKMLTAENADNFLQDLLNTIEWKNDEAVFFGKHITTKRKVAWYGNRGYLYRYSNTEKIALPWTPSLLALKRMAEEVSGEVYNSCLLNLYHTGEEGMAWHSDDEKTLAPDSAIASISLGAERKFSFKHKTSKDTVSLLLEHGSLLVMKDATQTHWLHSLPKTKKIQVPRINLTFRQMLE
jgi:alkylated DNA repair dioxygenase AlkB